MSYSKASLHCVACGKYLGDNNDLITSGPHMGARPTDLTVFCEKTGKQESVVDDYAGLEARRKWNTWFARLLRDETRYFVAKEPPDSSTKEGLTAVVDTTSPSNWRDAGKKARAHNLHSGTRPVE